MTERKLEEMNHWELIAEIHALRMVRDDLERVLQSRLGNGGWLELRAYRPDGKSEPCPVESRTLAAIAVRKLGEELSSRVLLHRQNALLRQYALNFLEPVHGRALAEDLQRLES